MTAAVLQGFAADLLVALHAAFVAFVVLGGLLLFRWPRAAWLHLPAALWGAAVELGGWICPLTPWEQALRQAAGEGGWQGSFIGHYLLPLIYPDGLSRETQLLLGLLVVLVNAVIYTTWWRRRGRPAR